MFQEKIKAIIFSLMFQVLLSESDQKVETWISPLVAVPSPPGPLAKYGYT